MTVYKLWCELNRLMESGQIDPNAIAIVSRPDWSASRNGERIEHELNGVCYNQSRLELCAMSEEATAISRKERQR